MSNEMIFWFMLGAASSILVSLLISTIMDYFNPKTEKDKIQDGLIKQLQEKVFFLEQKVGDLKTTERTLRGAYTDMSTQIDNLKAAMPKSKKKS